MFFCHVSTLRWKRRYFLWFMTTLLQLGVFARTNKCWKCQQTSSQHIDRQSSVSPGGRLITGWSWISKKLICGTAFCQPINNKKKKKTNSKFEHLTLDIDECDEETYSCPKFSRCKNKNGGYECPCKVGYEKTPQGTCSGKAEFLKLLIIWATSYPLGFPLLPQTLNFNRAVSNFRVWKVKWETQSRHAGYQTLEFYTCFPQFPGFLKQFLPWRLGNLERIGHLNLEVKFNKQENFCTRPHISLKHGYI